MVSRETYIFHMLVGAFNNTPRKYGSYFLQNVEIKD